MDCKRNTKGLVLQELSGSVVVCVPSVLHSISQMTAMEGASAAPKVGYYVYIHMQHRAERALYDTPAGPRPVASDAEMSEFRDKMKLLGEVGTHAVER